MCGINKRIESVFSESKLKNIEIAEKLNLSPASISKLRAGNQNPSERTIIDICDKFGVNRTWLETGGGPKRTEQAKEVELYDFFAATLRDDVPYRKEVIRCLSKMSPAQWKLAGEFLQSLADELRSTEEK